MPESVRALFKPRFGYDFSDVRVHADTRAAESARAVNALAYTVGRDIVFGTGQFEPHTVKGQRLLAHELTHVVQQRGSRRVLSRWTVKGVLKELCSGPDRSTVDQLRETGVRQVKRITKADKVFEKKQDGSKGKFLRYSYRRGAAMYDPSRDRIMIAAEIANVSNQQASSILYHEVVHRRHARIEPIPNADELEDEVQTMIAEEKFRIRHGFPPILPQYRKESAGTITVNEDEIRKDVTEGFSGDPSAALIYERDKVVAMPPVKEITGWNCPSP